MSLSEEELRSTKSHARATGIVAAVALGATVLADLILPPKPALLLGALGILVTLGCGGQCVFQTATLISHALQGRRRMQFQVAVSLAAPVLIALILSTLVDAVPLYTLTLIMTPWLLIPLGIIAWASWAAGDFLDRQHPFRGFLIAAAILGVLCLFWTFGMTGGDADDYDPEGGSGGFYFDPEKKAHARATGEYVWRFLIYVSTSYLALFLRWRRDIAPKVRRLP